MRGTRQKRRSTRAGRGWKGLTYSLGLALSNSPFASVTQPSCFSRVIMAKLSFLGAWLCAGLASAAIIKRDYPSDDPLTSCPGYKASNVKTSPTGLTADLTLAGSACNVYGDDLKDLILQVTYETGEILL